MKSLSFYRKQVEDQKAWIAKCEAGVSYKDLTKGEAIRQADLNELAKRERYYELAKSKVHLVDENESLTKDIQALLTAQDRFMAAKNEFDDLKNIFETYYPRFWEKVSKINGHKRVDYCTEQQFTTDGICCEVDAFYCGEEDRWNIFVPWFYFASEQAYKDQYAEWIRLKAIEAAAKKVSEAQKRIEELQDEDLKAAKAKEVRHQVCFTELKLAQEELDKLNKG